MSNRNSRPTPPGDEKIETTFQRLRQDGYSRLEAVRVILDVLDVSLAEAKRLLMSSDTWNDACSVPETKGGTEKEGTDADDPVPPAPA